MAATSPPRYSRLGVAICAIASWAIAATAPAGAIVGGRAISVASAPWTVFIQDARATSSFFCTGTILDASHIITAAHCLYDNTGTIATPADVSVEAGVSDDITPDPGDHAQSVAVASFRVHPGYVWSAPSGDDDVAILTLASPLKLGGPDARAVVLPPAGAPFPGGARGRVAGFGREQAGYPPTGQLNVMIATVDPQGSCGQRPQSGLLPDDAVALCASAPHAATCNGDSGAGLVTMGSDPTLIGVVSRGSAACTPGSHTRFTYIGAPEILRFIHGDLHPPVAPRETKATFINLSWSPPLVVGATLECSSGGWGQPVSLRYAFVTASGRVLEAGAHPDYTLTAAARGQSIGCMVRAAGAGGTALEETGLTTPVSAAPALEIAHIPPLSGSRGSLLTVAVALHAPRGLSGLFGACVIPPPTVGPRDCNSLAHQSGGRGWFRFVLSVPVKPTAPLGVAHLGVDAVAGVAHATASVVARIGA